MTIDTKNTGQMGPGHILRFVPLGSVINAMVIAAYLKAEKTFRWEKTRPWGVRPVMAAPALTAAVLVELALAAC